MMDSSDDAARQDLPTTADAERLLGEGKLAEAREIFERLHAEDPKSAKVQGLLALTLFKMSEFERAAELYEQLVHDNPIDPTLRINLGLVCVKSQKFERAIEELEIALDLDPEHKKAQSYLGLALAQIGQYARAQACFIRAGNLNMAERMEQALKESGGDVPVAGDRPAEAAGSPPETGAGAMAEMAEEIPDAQAAAVPEVAGGAAPPAEWRDELTVEIIDGIEVDSDVELAEAMEAEAFGESAPAEVEALDIDLDSADAPGARLDSPPIQQVVGKVRFNSKHFDSLDMVGTQTTLAGNEGDDPFVLGAPVEIRVRGELFSRIGGLLIATGELGFAPVQKRFQGTSIDQMFGSGEKQVLRVLGDGALAIAPEGKTFVSIQLRGETAFFQERWLYAFEKSLSFENGRIPLIRDRELELVYLSGTGCLLLALPGPLLSKSVQESSCHMPLDRVVGWYGRLIPRVATFPEDSQAIADALTLVELSGRGVVLFTHEEGAC